ncbi:MAG: hypothetical protein ACKVZJ_02830, partial [Phycisphaerales bacterium]
MPEPTKPTPAPVPFDESQPAMPAPGSFQVSDSAATSALWSTVARSLAGLTRRARRVLVTQRVVVLIAATIAVAIALALLDYALRVPGWLRMLTLPAWLGLLGWSWWTWVRPALRFNPDETEVAL